MLSIQKIRDVAYYENLAELDDYYLEGEASAGRWLGEGAQALGLTGKVESEDLRRLFAGFSSEGKRLVQNAGKVKKKAGEKGHAPGWDLTFSAPKSVSVIWGLGNDALRHAVEAAHHDAVEIALRVAEQECGFSRRGKGGLVFERCRLAIATFRHETSRALDPNLHTHCLVANVGVGPDGKTRTIASQQFYRWKMTLGKVYQTELSHRLQTIVGLPTQVTDDSFEVLGISPELRRLFSQRRRQIETALKEKGLAQTAKASEAAALNTRQKKQPFSTTLLRQVWREAHAEIEPEGTLFELLTQAQPLREPSFSLLEMFLERAVSRVTQNESHFTIQTLVRALGPEAIREGISAANLLAGVRHYLNVSPSIVRLGERDLETRFTTTEMLSQETSLYDAALKLHSRHQHHVSQAAIAAVLSQHPGVANRLEQSAALDHLLLAGDLKLLAGMPGTGKTFVLDAARDAWERAGYRVVGTAVAGKAARELSAKAGFFADTAAKFLTEFKKPPGERGATYVLDSGTVFVIDEAGMLDTPLAAQLLEEARQQGAKVILVGDPYQLPPIGPGAPFEALLARFPHCELSQIARQKDPADIKAIQDLRAGNVDAMLASYSQRGRLAVLIDKRHAIEQLVRDWSSAGGSEDPLRHVILVTTNADRFAMNDACQWERLSKIVEPLSPPAVIRTGVAGAQVEERFFVGDPVLCLKRSRVLGLENGTTGVVTAVKPDAGLIALCIHDAQGPKEIVVSLSDYPHVTRGYATTCHKGQGQTMDYVYVLLGGNMQAREMTYTELSRARESTRLYATCKDAGYELEGLATMIARTRPKPLAHEFLRELELGSVEEPAAPLIPASEPPYPRISL